MTTSANPYEPPATPSALLIPDELVSRLINEDNTETLVFYDVSDTQIYGTRHRKELQGALASSAESSGCFPEVYQTIHWLCLVHMPLWPLATYIVMPCKECDDPDGDADQYRAIRVDTDWEQVVRHYLVFLLILAFIVIGPYLWLAQR